LLSPHEQKAAARLSIFRGGFRREGAHAVAAARVPDLASLIDKSLIQVVTEFRSLDERVAGSPQQEGSQESGLRYEIHELLRQFLRDKLIEMGDEEEIARRHIEYFTAMAEKVEAHHYATVPHQWFMQLRAEQGNLRAALEWSLSAQRETQLGLRLVSSLGRFWYMGDAWKEGCEWLHTALAQVDATTPPAIHAMLLTQLGDLEHAMAEYPSAKRHLEEAVAIWSAIDDDLHLAWAIFHLGVLHSTIADYPKAEAYYDESLAIYRRLNEPWFVALLLMQQASTAITYDDFERGFELLEEALPILRTEEGSNTMAVALNLLGWASVHKGDHLIAIGNFNEALAIGQLQGNYQMMGWCLRNLGLAHVMIQEFDKAEQYLRQCLRFYQQISFKSGMVIAFEIQARAAAEQGNMEAGVRWLAVAEKLRQAIGLPRTSGDERLYYNRAYELTRAALGQAAWDAAWAVASKLTLDEALALVQGG
jgi:tetratricopeptide (TPR) repeat protein